MGRASRRSQHVNRPSEKDHSYSRSVDKKEQQKTSTPAKGKNSGIEKYSKTACTKENANSDDEFSDVEIEPYKCAGCSKTTHTIDPPLQCDFCENLYCYHCSQISSKQSYQHLGKYKEDDGTMWFCHHCRVSFPGVRKMVCRVTKIEEALDTVVKRLGELENNGIDAKINDALHEQREIDSRKLNIMCFGLPEEDQRFSDQESPDQESQDQNSKQDSQIIDNIITDVMGLEKDSVLTEKPVRVGKFNPDRTKCRPLKLTVKNMEAKKKVLQAARTRIRYSENPLCKNLFFHPDLTRAQRDEAFARRESRRLLRAEEAEKAQHSVNRPLMTRRPNRDDSLMTRRPNRDDSSLMTKRPNRDDSSTQSMESSQRRLDLELAGGGRPFRDSQN